jgi:hypothetical protein
VAEKKEESIFPRVEAKKYISSRIGILAYDDTPLDLHFASTFKIPESGVNRRVSGEWRRGDHAGQASTGSKACISLVYLYNHYTETRIS